MPRPLHSSLPHIKVLRSYNNLHQGQRGFLVGGGSSLLALQDGGFDFHQMEKKEVVVGINKAYKLFLPTYLVFGDRIFWDSFREEIRTLSCIKFAPQDILKGSTTPSQKETSLLPLQRDANTRDILPKGLEGPISFRNNSGVAGLRVLYCLGCNPLYLLGIDLTTSNQGETHFHHDYRAIGRKSRPESYKQFYVEFAKTIAALKTRDISVFSCSSISLLNAVIPYVPLSSLFAQEGN